MAANLSRLDEPALPEDEKDRHIPQVEEDTSIDGAELPKGYFLSPFFLGTLLASGLSVSAVRKVSST